MASNSTSSSAPSTSNEMFGYSPSLPMAWMGSILFTVSTLLHVFQYFKHRAFYLYLFLIGLGMEVAAYWIRIVAIKDPNNGVAAGMSYLLITLAPSFLAAACYMTFGRIIYYVTPEDRRTIRYTWVPTKWITTTFVVGDFLTFFVVCIGIFVLIGNTTRKDLSVEQQAAGLRMTYQILRVGFIMQLVVFFAFMTVAFRFMFASKAWRYDWPGSGGTRWRKLGWTIFAAIGLILVRSLYRCLLFTVNEGDNYARTHEWMYYMFDTLPIIGVLAIFNLFHPGHYLSTEYTTIRHTYKTEGFRPVAPMLKTVDDEPAPRYSRVTVVPPPLEPQSSYPQMNQVPQKESGMSFSDPWNNRPSPGAERY